MMDQNDLLTSTPAAGGPGSAKVTLYTDSFVVKGLLRTRQRRLSDSLNDAAETFLVLEDASFEEFGSHAIADRASFAQINLETVLFGVAEEEIEPAPEMRMLKIRQEALINVPPFRITGKIHLPPNEDLRNGLGELRGRFVPVTDAVFWSERLGEPRTSVPMVAVNHARAHILAPHEERDVWAVPDQRSAARAASGARAAGAAEAWPASDRPTAETGEAPSGGVDPWRDLPGSGEG